MYVFFHLLLCSPSYTSCYAWTLSALMDHPHLFYFSLFLFLKYQEGQGTVRDIVYTIILFSVFFNRTLKGTVMFFLFPRRPSLDHLHLFSSFIFFLFYFLILIRDKGQ